MHIFMIDGIGPFFRGYRKRRINWSKIPFHQFHQEPQQRRRQFDRIGRDLETFAARVREVGYNSVSLDDVAHLAPHPWLEPEINRTIISLQREYAVLFGILKRYGLDIYLTMDVLSFTPQLKTRIGGSREKAIGYLREQVETVLSSFPEIRGLILRIGESDGQDVKGDFRSELLLRSPGEVNRMLRAVLPICAGYGRYLILRTWTVGAYRVGDLIWHRGTTARVLRGIDSPWFILSMKYGESDFFRYLPLNRHFFRVKVKTLVELQARREYEGCGEYPSFIGWEYQEYARQLRDLGNLAGISVWCQTGGWVPFRRLTYLEPEGIWNELNSYLCVKLFRDNLDVEQAVLAFAREKSCPDPQQLLEFLKLDHQVIRELLYIEDLADQKLFFRRVRIPPLLSVFWNNIFINHSVRKVLLSLVQDHRGCVETGYAALEKIERMRELSEVLGLPTDDIVYMQDTFRLLALAREYYFLPYSEEVRRSIKAAKKQYKKRYPKGSRPRYRVKTDFTPFRLKRSRLSLLLRLLLRRQRGYRAVDYLLTLHLLALLYRLIVRARPETVPKFARKQAMGLDTIFR